MVWSLRVPGPASIVYYKTQFGSHLCQGAHSTSGKGCQPTSLTVRDPDRLKSDHRPITRRQTLTKGVHTVALIITHTQRPSRRSEMPVAMISPHKVCVQNVQLCHVTSHGTMLGVWAERALTAMLQQCDILWMWMPVDNRSRSGRS